MTLLSTFKAFVIQDVPPELDGCGDCNEPHCTQGQWEVCTRRLVAVAERRAEGDGCL